MPKESSITAEKEQVEKELLAKEGEIRQGVQALQEEVGDVAPSVRDAIFGHPLVSVCGALAAGVLVGLIFGKKKRSRDAFGAGANHRALIDRYVASIAEETRHRAADGEDIDQAVARALQERVPLIVYEVPEAAERSGVLGHILRLASRELIPLGLQAGLGFLGVGDPEDAEDPAP